MKITNAGRISKSEMMSSSRKRQRKNGKGRQPRSNGRSTSINPRSKYNEYTTRAREAAASGDVIAAENMYQHADHYYRMMNLE